MESRPGATSTSSWYEPCFRELFFQSLSRFIQSSDRFESLTRCLRMQVNLPSEACGLVLSNLKVSPYASKACTHLRVAHIDRLRRMTYLGCAIPPHTHRWQR